MATVIERPRRVRRLTDEELVKYLTTYMRSGKKKLNELKKEWDANDAIYQVVSSQRRAAGAVDARFFAVQNQIADNSSAGALSSKVSSSMVSHHSKLIMSEPTVIAESLETDLLNRTVEEYTQQYCDNLYKQYTLKTVLASSVFMDVTVKGIGVLYVGWSKFKGEVKVRPVDPDGEIEMTGDHVFRRQNPKYFIIDPTATVFEVDAKNCCAGEEVPIEDLRWAYPDNFEDILAACEEKKKGFNEESDDNNDMDAHDRPTSAILWTYYEKHSVENGMRGAAVKFIYSAGENVTILSREDLDRQDGDLPFCVLTDLDLTDDPYGMSRATLCSKHHDRLSKFFDDIEKNTEFFGKTRFLTPTTMNANVLTSDHAIAIPFNSITGEKPIYLPPSSVTSDIWRFHEILSREIDMCYSSGEFDRGEINRELSSFAVLTAIERSEAKLMHLFNKKKSFVSRLYKLAISDAQQYITEEREFASTSRMSGYKFTSFKGADLVGRVNINVGFGQYMPIDPAARKQQLFELVKLGLPEKAGLPQKEIISNLMGGDLKKVKTIADMAKDVQTEEIYRMISGEPAPVQPYHEHLTHLSVCASFMNESVFERLPAQVKQTIYDHFSEHNAEAAKTIAAAQGGAGAGGAVPPGGEGMPENAQMPGAEAPQSATPPMPVA